MQPDATISQEPEYSYPVQAPTKSPGSSGILTGILILFLLLLLCGLAGLGYWTYTLNNDLKTAQQNLATLQGNYNDLTTQKNAVSAELDQVNQEVAKVKGEVASTKETLAAVQDDVSKVNSDIAAIKEKMDSARVYIEIMRGIFEDNDSYEDTFAKIQDMNDSRLEELYTTHKAKKVYETWVPFADYLLSTVLDLLKK